MPGAQRHDGRIARSVLFLVVYDEEMDMAKKGRRPQLPIIVPCLLRDGHGEKRGTTAFSFSRETTAIFDACLLLGGVGMAKAPAKRLQLAVYY